MADDPLHYPRPEFTHETYRSMATGFAPYLTLFGPRRTGKTQFLTQDLAPKAETYGHRVIYMDFMERGLSPLALLLYAIDMALQAKGTVAQLVQAVRTIAPRITLKAIPGVEATIDIAAPQQEMPADQLLLLDTYLGALAVAKAVPFLIFDEFQDIARSPDADSFITALRSGLSSRPGQFAGIFTGSSHTGLRALFSTKTAPFYRFATDIQLPPLGAGFVDHQLAHYPAQETAPIADREAMQTFKTLGGNPEYFRRFLRERAFAPALCGQEVLEGLIAKIADEQGFQPMWAALSDRDRLVLRMVTEGVQERWASEAAALAERFGLAAAPGSSGIQTSMNKLISRDMVMDMGASGRIVTDEVLADWVRSRPKEDFRP